MQQYNKNMSIVSVGCFTVAWSTHNSTHIDNITVYRDTPVPEDLLETCPTKAAIFLCISYHKKGKYPTTTLRNYITGMLTFADVHRYTLRILSGLVVIKGSLKMFIGSKKQAYAPGLAKLKWSLRHD